MKTQKIFLTIILMLVVFLASTSSVNAMEENAEDEDKVCSPYILILNPDSTLDHFPLKETKVTTNIDGVIAETFVVQSYSNEGENPINARYVFPASANVTIHGMQMVVGNNVVTARIKEKEEAKEEFETAKKEGKSASLLEQQRPNVFTMDVANIMPGDDVRIELHYTELIEPVEDTYQFIFPTVTGPRYVSPSKNEETGEESWVETPYLPEGQVPEGKYNITVNLSTGVPIADLSCKSHDIHVSKNGDSKAVVTLSDLKDYAGNRDFILEYKLNGQDVNCGLMVNKGEEENYFLLMVQPPERCELEDIPPREYMFVLDVSGSMQGFPLSTAKGLIRNLVSNLRECDSFNLMLFSDEITLMSPQSMAANEKNIKNALDLISEQEGGGGTELAPALENAIAFLGKKPAQSIVLITDGYIFDETEIFDIIDDHMDQVSFFPFGIGSSVNRYLIDGIAKAGQGESFIVTDSSEAEDMAARFRTYIESPVLTDIQVTCDGFDTYDIEPQRLPTLFAQRPLVMYGKWRGELTGTIKVTGKTGNKDYVQEIPVDQITPLTGNHEAIKYLWARKKIERLTDYGISQNDPGIKEEVTQLGLAYSMMTPYTSFVAVVDTIQNPSKKSTDVDQPLPLPLRVSDLAAGGYRLASEPGDIILALAAILAALIFFLCRAHKHRYERSRI